LVYILGEMISPLRMIALRSTIEMVKIECKYVGVDINTFSESYSILWTIFTSNVDYY